MSKTYEISDGEETPVLANKHRFLNNILLATDFSPASDRALEYAASLARRYCSMVYLTQIITVDGYPMVSPEFAASSLEKRHAEAENKFRELLKSGQFFALPRKTSSCVNQERKEALVGQASRRIAKLQQDAGIKADVFIGSGDVPKVLSQAAKQTNADLLINGCSLCCGPTATGLFARYRFRF